MSARDERLAFRGPKGDKGEPGMTRGTRRAVVYLFAFALLLAVSNLLWTSHAVSASQAAQARVLATSRALCLDSNQASARQVRLWQFILHIGKPPRTAAQRHVITGFEAYLHKAFAPQDCAALGVRRR